jgi:hypothetical protein
MDELNPRLGGVSFFRLDGARTYDETDSICARRRDHCPPRSIESPAAMASPRDMRARTLSGNNWLDIKAAAD